MKIVFFGCTKYSEALLNYLLGIDKEVIAIFSIPKRFNISYSENKVLNYNYSDLQIIANKNSIPYYEVDSEDGKKTIDYKNILSKLKPDIILVLGWYYMVPKKIRDIPKYGAWAIHSSLLPKYAGGAPLVWAIINGEKETGVTLFKIDSGVDDGDIIQQKKFRIEINDTIKEVYEKAIKASKQILLKTLSSQPEKIKFIKQNKRKIKIYPQRRPSDGKINWNWDRKRIRNFIRAQTKPYPGAYTIINKRKITIWDADIENI